MQHCSGLCGIFITCSCCNVQFSCICSLHIHFCKEKRVLKYLIDTELCTASDFVENNEISIKTNKNIPEKTENRVRNGGFQDNIHCRSTNTSDRENVGYGVLQNHGPRQSTSEETAGTIYTYDRTLSCSIHENLKSGYAVTVADDAAPEVDVAIDSATPSNEPVVGVFSETSDVADNDEFLQEPEVLIMEKVTKSVRQRYSPVKSTNIQVPCDICGYLFKRRNLKRHMQSHASTRDYTCEICQKVFQTESSLHCHKLHHTEEKVYLCHFCGKLFNNGPNLRQHMKSHTRERTLQCPVCQKMFQSNYVLKDHISRHSDERPYTCKVCNRSFRKSQELKRHMIAHSEARNHMCKICSKTFKSKSNRIKHEKIHCRTKHNTDCHS